MHHVQSAHSREPGKCTNVPVWNGAGSMACQRICGGLAMIRCLRLRVQQRLDIRAIPAAVERVGQHLADDLIVLSVD
jgi:hypothetical protein